MHNNRVGSVVDSEKTVFQGSDEMMLNTLPDIPVELTLVVLAPELRKSRVQS